MGAAETILVAGAGAVGLTCALRLAEAGFSVVLADPGGPNASSVAAGMLAPAFECAMDPASAEHYPLLVAARDLWPDLAARIGLELDRSGALAVGGYRAVETWTDELVALGASARRLSPDDAQRLQPALTVHSPGVYTADDWRLEPADALRRLAATAAETGVTTRIAEVAGWSPGAGRLSTGETVTAASLVVCTGYAETLAPEFAALTPIKGQIVRLEGVAFSGPVVRAAGLYVAPSASGAFAGATMEPGRRDSRIDQATVGRFTDGAIALIAGLADAVPHGQAGVRAATPDGLPLVGKSVAEGVIVAAGTRRNGWLLAPLIAEEVLRAARGEEPGPRAARFAPGRFA